MGTSRRSGVSSEREKWDKVFNSLVKLLKGQEEHLQTLLKERKILEDRIMMQHERWVSDVRSLEEHISQVKESLAEKEMACLLEAKKSDLMAGLMQREASLCKMKLDQTEDELADFRAWYDDLSRKIEGNSVRTSGVKGGQEMMENEVGRLKLQLEKLASEKSSEISLLMKEKGFVWNQYECLDETLTSKLKSKEAEVEQANVKIKKLLSSMEHLHSSNNEKDETIGKLKTRVAEMEADANKWRDEILKLSQELDLLKKSKTTYITPASRRCNTGATTSCNGGKKRFRTGSGFPLKKESNPAQDPGKDADKVTRSSKRKPVDVTNNDFNSPKLFSSAFKVPKLKMLSTPVR